MCETSCSDTHCDLRIDVIDKIVLTRKIHAVCAYEKVAMKYHLSTGNLLDAPKNRKLIESLGFKSKKYWYMVFHYKPLLNF